MSIYKSRASTAGAPRKRGVYICMYVGTKHKAACRQGWMVVTCLGARGLEDKKETKKPTQLGKGVGGGLVIFHKEIIS